MIFFLQFFLSSGKKKQNKIQHSVSSPLLCNIKIKKVYCFINFASHSEWFILWAMCLPCVCHCTVSPVSVISGWLLEFYFHEGINHCFAMVWTVDLTGWGIYYCLYNFLKLSEIFVSARIPVGLLYHSCLTILIWLSNSYILFYSYIFICY